MTTILSSGAWVRFRGVAHRIARQSPVWGDHGGRTACGRFVMTRWASAPATPATDRDERCASCEAVA